MSGGFPDPPKTANIESRLQKLIWVNDIALGCDNIGNYDIHAIDVALWVIGERPVAAAGSSGIVRKDPHGDGHDVISVVYQYANGVIHNHFGQALNNTSGGNLSVACFGPVAQALVNYWGKAFLRGGPQQFNGDKIENLYGLGATRNIASFHQQITEGKCANETARMGIDSCLATILGREACLRKGRLTMEELLKANRKLEVDLTGLRT